MTRCTEVKVIKNAFIAPYLCFLADAHSPMDLFLLEKSLCSQK
jgi:hypothetical protein